MDEIIKMCNVFFFINFYFKPRNHETFIVECIVCLLYLSQNKGTEKYFTSCFWCTIYNVDISLSLSPCCMSPYLCTIDISFETMASTFIGGKLNKGKSSSRVCVSGF